MTNLTYSPFVWPLTLTIVLALTLAVIVRRQPAGKGTVPFTILQIALVIWATADTLGLLLPAPEAKRLVGSVSYIGIAIVPMAWLLFTLEYTGRGHRVTRRLLLLLLIEPVLTVLAVSINPNNLFWKSITLRSYDQFAVLEVSYGILFWVHAVYSYTLLLIGMGLLALAYRRAERLYRLQILTMLIGALAPWITNAASILRLIEVPIDLTPMAFAVTGLSMAFGMIRFRFFDLVPVARATVIESLPDPVIVLDPQRRILDLNPAARTLFEIAPNRDIVGQSAEAILTELGYPVTRLVEAVATQDELVLQSARQRGDQPAMPRHFSLQQSRINDSKGNLTARVLVLHEVTALKEASQRIAAQNAALQETNEALDLARRVADDANRLKSQFLANMSHELRTPLNAIIGYSQLQISGMAGEIPARAKEFQERTLLNARDLLKLINDLLDISKIEAGRMEMVVKTFNLYVLLQEIETQNRVLADQKGLTFRVQVDALMPHAIVGDQARVKQIMTNLLANAFKFTAKGFVELRIEKSGLNTWRIVVADSGPGIPPHLHDVIFDEFRQAENQTSNLQGGTGLGLAIVRRLVVMMGGTVNLRSQVGQGSEFTVVLPIVIETSANIHKEAVNGVAH